MCKFKGIFGEPNTGVHKLRIFNIAIVDVVATIIVAYGISKATTWDFVLVLISLFVLGIILHRIFYVRTTLDKVFFD